MQISTKDSLDNADPALEQVEWTGLAFKKDKTYDLFILSVPQLSLAFWAVNIFFCALFSIGITGIFFFFLTIITSQAYITTILSALRSFKVLKECNNYL